VLLECRADRVVGERPPGEHFLPPGNELVVAVYDLPDLGKPLVEVGYAGGLAAPVTWRYSDAMIDLVPRPSTTIARMASFSSNTYAEDPRD